MVDRFWGFVLRFVLRRPTFAGEVAVSAPSPREKMLNSLQEANLYKKQLDYLRASNEETKRHIQELADELRTWNHPFNRPCPPDLPCPTCTIANKLEEIIA